MSYDKIDEVELFLSIGSNLGDRKSNLKKAIQLLKEKINNKIICSPIYESKALGFESESNFLNLCTKTTTYLKPDKILLLIQSIESEMGRIRVEKSGYVDRIIDIDILFYGNFVVNTKNLKIPHPHLYTRKFVLKPLYDIAPKLIDPSYGKGLIEIIKECNDDSTLLLFEK